MTFRSLRNIAAGLRRLGTDEMVLDRATGTLHYRNAAGAAVAAPIVQVAAKTIALHFAGGGAGLPPTVTVLFNSTTLGAIVSVTRSSTGIFQLTIVGGSSIGLLPHAQGTNNDGSVLRSSLLARTFNGTNTALTFDTRNGSGQSTDPNPWDEYLHVLYQR